MLLEIFPLGPYQTNAYIVACSATLEAAIIDAPRGSATLLPQRIQALNLKAKFLLLTHSHWDHIADAAPLKEALHVPLLVHIEDAKNVEEPGADGLPFHIPIEEALCDGYLIDGQKIKLGEMEIRVIHTPGHTPGGVCFYIPQEGALFSGDTLFQGSIGNVELPTADPERMWESLKRLGTLPLDTKVYPGHGRSTTIGQEKEQYL